MSCQLLIFAKIPEMGHGKSRLAVTLGQEATLQISQFLLTRTLEVASSCSDVCLWFTPDEAVDAVAMIRRIGWQCRPQGDGDLGARMSRAFRLAFEDGADSAMVIGTDCPTMTPSDLEQAVRALETTELVVGPAPDGGYWLLGMRRHHPELFEQVPWSTAEVLAITLERIRTAGWSHEILRTLSDIDTEADWRSFQASEGSAER